MATQNDTPEKKPAAKKAPAKKPAEKKAPVEREIIRVNQEAGEAAETVKKTVKRSVADVEETVQEASAAAEETVAAAEETVEATAETVAEAVEKPAPKAERTVVSKAGEAAKAPVAKKSSMPWRICAFVFWLIGILGMVGAVIMIMEGNERLMYVGIGVAAVACVIGSMLWKKANRISPCTVKQDGTFGAKLKTFLWNQMGVVFTFITFLPIGLALMLKSDKLSPQGKKIASILTAVLIAIVGALSYDYNAPVAEAETRTTDAQLEEQINSGEVTVPTGYDDKLDTEAYWTKYGYSFHFSQDCQTIARSLTIYSGVLRDALGAHKLDPCDFCADGASAK